MEAEEDGEGGENEGRSCWLPTGWAPGCQAVLQSRVHPCGHLSAYPPATFSSGAVCSCDFSLLQPVSRADYPVSLLFISSFLKRG